MSKIIPKFISRTIIVDVISFLIVLNFKLQATCYIVTKGIFIPTIFQDKIT